uniref:Uncharacterized protein n=1 Tax=Cacopsylla melanoneura TaxID=428564 RepID=A0A8D9AP45_9HEMI
MECVDAHGTILFTSMKLLRIKLKNSLTTVRTESVVFHCYRIHISFSIFLLMIFRVSLSLSLLHPVYIGLLVHFYTLKFTLHYSKFHFSYCVSVSLSLSLTPCIHWTTSPLLYSQVHPALFQVPL